MTAFARPYRTRGTRIGLPVSRVEILSQKSNVGVFVADQPIHIRLNHPPVFGRQFIRLLQFAGMSPVQFEMGDGFLHRFATPH
jgi:hypothetical protein